MFVLIKQNKLKQTIRKRYNNQVVIQRHETTRIDRATVIVFDDPNVLTCIRVPNLGCAVTAC